MKYLNHAGKARIRSFTLVELLVIICIISILAGLLLPSLKKARDMARGIACVSNLRQQGTAIRTYCNDYNGGLPTCTDYGTAIGLYLGNTNGNGAWRGQTINESCLWCPAVKKPVTAAYSYGLNYPVVFSYSAWEAGDGMGKSRQLDNVPNNVYLVADTANNGYIMDPQMWTFNTDADTDGVNDSYNYPATFSEPYNFFSPRHNDAANCLFSDGSVRKVPRLDFIKNVNGIWGKRDRP